MFLPAPKQVEFYEVQRRHRRTLFGGAAGGTKSHTIRWGLYRYGLTIPECNMLILRRTYKELDETHLREMRRDGPKLGAVYNKGDRTLEFPQTGSVITAGHCESAEDYERYLSTEYDIIAIDELVTFEEGPALEIFSRARTSKPKVLELLGGAKVWGGTNPGGRGANWVKDWFIDRSPDPAKYPKYRAEEYAFVPATLADNPYIDPAYRETLEQLPETRRRQLLDGDWTAYEGRFFAAWRATVDGQPWHVAEQTIVAETEWVGAIDWGYNAPGSFGLYACLSDGHYHRAAELKFQGQHVEEVGAAMWKLVRGRIGKGRLRSVVGDPSMWNKTGAGRGESIAEGLQRLKLPMRKGDNTRGKNGWQTCHDLLRTAPDGRPWLTVDPSCSYFIRTVPVLPQDPHDPDDADTGAEDHAADEFRYFANSRPSPTRWAAQPAYTKHMMGHLLEEARRESAYAR